MKKLALLLSILLMGSMLAGCNNDKEEEDASGSESTSASDTSGSESASGDEGDASTSGATGDTSGAEAAPAEEAPPPAPAAPSIATMAGKFVSFDVDRYPDSRAPILDLSDKGGFVFQFNTGEGDIDVLTGTFDLSGTSMILEVLYRNGEDYLGQELKTITFTMVDEYTLDYNSESLGLTRKGDRFLRVGPPPTVTAAREEPAFASDQPAGDTAGADADASSGAASEAPESATSMAEDA